MRHTRFFLYFLPILVIPFLASCGVGNGNGHDVPQGDTIPTKYLTNLTMVDYGDYIKADFRNPWDTTTTLQTFLLVPADRDLPASLPEGTVLRTPLERSVVYTSVHSSLIDQLGALDAIAGVCDSKYITKPSVRQQIDSGKIADCGSTATPNIEKILQLRPDAILLSAFENSNDHNKVGQIGIPIIDCIDYMETSPLARAEWMRFFGRLYGKGAEADSLFDATERAYLALKAKTAKVDKRPAVLTEMIYGQSWDVAGALSTTGVYIEDAGGKNPFDTYKRSGSIKLSPEEVLFKAMDADVWMLKYWQKDAPRLSQLAADNEVYAKFRAFAEGNVYGCDTNSSSFFEDAAFHPQWILAEYINIIHPEIDGVEGSQHYFKKLEP